MVGECQIRGVDIAGFGESVQRGLIKEKNRRIEAVEMLQCNESTNSNKYVQLNLPPGTANTDRQLRRRNRAVFVRSWPAQRDDVHRWIRTFHYPISVMAPLESPLFHCVPSGKLTGTENI